MDFNPSNIQSDETSFRVDDTRVAAVKSKALAAYFAPHEIQFMPTDQSDGSRFYGKPHAFAVLNRLDIVLGQDGWKESYENLNNGAVRCTIHARFTPDGDWVSRCSVGTGTTDKARHTDAFERAAVKLGIGRYLYELPDIVVQPGEKPIMPQSLLPVAYRWCGRADGATVIQQLESCCEQAQVPRDKYREAYERLIARYGYDPTTKPDKLANRDVTAIRQQLIGWLNSSVANVKNSYYSPFYEVPAEPKSAPKPEPKPEPKIEPKHEQPIKPQPAEPVQPKTGYPPNGTELLARLMMQGARLEKSGLCSCQTFIDHIHQCGIAKKFPKKFEDWFGDHIKQAYKFAQDFTDKLASDKEGDK